MLCYSTTRQLCILRSTDACDLGIALDEADASTLRADDLAAALPDVIPADSLADAQLILAHELAPAPAWTLILPRESRGQRRRRSLCARVHPGQSPSTLARTSPSRAWYGLDLAALNFPGCTLLSVADFPLLTERVVEGAAVFHLNMVAPRSTLALSPDMADLPEQPRRTFAAPLCLAHAPSIWSPARLLSCAVRGGLRYQLSADQIEPRELFAEDLCKSMPWHPRAN